MPIVQPTRTFDTTRIDEGAQDRVQEIDCTQYGKDFEPLKFKQGEIVDIEPETHAEDLIEYGRVHQQGERDTRDSGEQKFDR